MPKSGHCIYCGVETTGAEGLAHVYPEGIIRNQHVLPRGLVCDACNQYLGHELDGMLLEYPVISIAVQFCALPGKRRKPRKLLGGIQLAITSAGKSDLRMSTDDVDVQRTAERKHIVDWAVKPTRAFDLGRFRRALHHIAFNAFAQMAGASAALRGEFDRIRAYVRAPDRHETWSFAERAVALDTTPKFGVHWLVEGGQIFALIEVGLTTFAVGLQPEQDFASLVTRHNFSLVGPTVTMPGAVRLRYVEE